MTANARLIALESFLQDDRDNMKLYETQKKLLEISGSEIEETGLKKLRNIPVLIAESGATFPAGKSLIRIGLSTGAMEIVRYFQGQPGTNFDKGSFEILINRLQDATKEIQKMVESEGNVFIRKDGTISELIDSSKAI